MAASAAYPALLPAQERTFTFQHRDGHHQQHTVLLTDGGVYDNLGLSVLEPRRSPQHTQHVYDVPFIIACDAGLGELPLKTPHFMLERLSRSFATVHRKAQDSARARLHEWAASGRIDGFALAYLGMKDDSLPASPADLVPRRAVASYPTNFAALARSNFEAITTRGEQLMRTVLPMYLRSAHRFKPGTEPVGVTGPAALRGRRRSSRIRAECVRHLESRGTKPMYTQQPLRRFGSQFVLEQQKRYSKRPPENRMLSYDLAVLDEYEPWRIWLDEQLDLLPQNTAKTFAANLWRDQNFWPDVIELAAGAALRRRGFGVEFERRWGNLTPDWTVIDDGTPLALVEVLTHSPRKGTTAKIKAWHALVERLKEIPVPIVLTVAGDPSSPLQAPGAGTAKKIAQDLRRVLLSPLHQRAFRSQGYTFLLQADPSTGQTMRAPGMRTILLPRAISLASSPPSRWPQGSKRRSANTARWPRRLGSRCSSRQARTSSPASKSSTSTICFAAPPRSACSSTSATRSSTTRPRSTRPICRAGPCLPSWPACCG
ncbi:hypothetical protein ACFWB3_24705 [[Kitasatospora] papulosa]|uniref:hypothetical protein n=1 Tax=[Kitasatospora] papulosa TaxID=1464011 RepID=UPI0036A6E0F9